MRVDEPSAIRFFEERPDLPVFEILKYRAETKAVMIPAALIVPHVGRKLMNKSLAFVMLVFGLAIVVSHAETNEAQPPRPADADEVTLFSYRGSYKMSPPPTLHSDLASIRITSVELLGERTALTTKITYAPHYGKIDSESLKFKNRHETQSVSILLNGDHTKKVKEGDILRTCFYPN